MTDIHTALLGLDHPHAVAHLRTLQTLPEITSITLWDPDEALLRETVREHDEKITATTTDLDSVLDQDRILFVVAALRNDLGPAYLYPVPLKPASI